VFARETGGKTDAVAVTLAAIVVGAGQILGGALCLMHGVANRVIGMHLGVIAGVMHNRAAFVITKAAHRSPAELERHTQNKHQ
jgi:zinc transporter ZupT